MKNMKNQQIILSKAKKSYLHNLFLKKVLILNSFSINYHLFLWVIKCIKIITLNNDKINIINNQLILYKKTLNNLLNYEFTI